MQCDTFKTIESINIDPIDANRDASLTIQQYVADNQNIWVGEIFLGVVVTYQQLWQPHVGT